MQLVGENFFGHSMDVSGYGAVLAAAWWNGLIQDHIAVRTGQAGKNGSSGYIELRRRKF